MSGAVETPPDVGAAGADGSAALHELLATVNQTWDGMLERMAPAVRRLRIAETDLEIVLVGETLAAVLLPGLEWHAEASGPPRAVVGAWDAEETGVALPSPLPAANPLVRRWVARQDGRPMAEADWSQPEMVCIGNRYARRHLLGVARTAALFQWEVGAPLRRQLWWALAPDVLFAHAAAVGTSDAAALIMGATGSGKSSTSLACLRAGMGFISDDYCLIRDDPPVVHLLAATARVAPHELVHLDGLGEPAVLCRPDAEHPVGYPAEKALFLLHRSVPERLVRSAPVRVVLLPELADERAPRLVPVRPTDALRATAPAALRQMHLDAQQELEGLRKLLTAVPTYRLLLSRDRDANPLAIQNALALATERSA